MQELLLGLHWQQTWVLAWGRPWGVAALGYWPPEAALFSPRLAAHWQAAQEAAAAVLRFGVQLAQQEQPSELQVQQHWMLAPLQEAVAAEPLQR